MFLNILLIVFTANFEFHLFCNLGKREFVCLYFSWANWYDENKYIYRFHASFSILRAVSITRRIMKNSCCESFNIIFEARVMPVPHHFYAKQKLFSGNHSVFFIFAFQEHQKCIIKASRKAKMQINFWLFNVYRHSASLDILDVPTANYSWANLLKQCRMLKCQGLD